MTRLHPCKSEITLRNCKDDNATTARETPGTPAGIALLSLPSDVVRRATRRSFTRFRPNRSAAEIGEADWVRGHRLLRERTLRPGSLLSCPSAGRKGSASQRLLLTGCRSSGLRARQRVDTGRGVVRTDWSHDGGKEVWPKRARTGRPSERPRDPCPPDEGPPPLESGNGAFRPDSPSARLRRHIHIHRDLVPRPQDLRRVDAVPAGDVPHCHPEARRDPRQRIPAPHRVAHLAHLAFY